RARKRCGSFWDAWKPLPPKGTMAGTRQICRRAGRSVGVWASGSKGISSTFASSVVLVRLLGSLRQTKISIIGKIPGGVYWKPVYHGLTGTIEVLVGNVHEMQRRPRRKIDKANARWIAELLAHDLIRPSFIPPLPRQALDGGIGGYQHPGGQFGDRL